MQDTNAIQNDMNSPSAFPDCPAGPSVHIKPISTKQRKFWTRIVAVTALAYIILGRPPAIAPPWLLEVLETAGLVLLVTAASGRVWCAMFAAGHKNEVLLSEGPYSITRNPLYVFSFLGTIGFGLAVENPLLALVLGVLFAAYYPFVVRKDERFLQSKFGTQFSDYCAQTPRWIPNFRLYREPLSLAVSPRRIRKCFFETTWFIWPFVFWEMLELLRKAGVLPTLF